MYDSVLFSRDTDDALPVGFSLFCSVLLLLLLLLLRLLLRQHRREWMS